MSDRCCLSQIQSPIFPCIVLFVAEMDSPGRLSSDQVEIFLVISSAQMFRHLFSVNSVIHPPSGGIYELSHIQVFPHESHMYLSRVGPLIFTALITTEPCYFTIPSVIFKLCLSFSILVLSWSLLACSKVETALFHLMTMAENILPTQPLT